MPIQHKKKMQFITLLNRTRQTSARWHMICGTHTTWLMTHPHSQEDGSQNLQGHLPSIYLGWVLYTWGLLTVKQAMTFASYSGQALPANCCCFIRHNFTSNFTYCKWLERMQAKPNQTNQQQQQKNPTIFLKLCLVFITSSLLCFTTSVSRVVGLKRGNTFSAWIWVLWQSTPEIPKILLSTKVFWTTISNFLWTYGNSAWCCSP